MNSKYDPPELPVSSTVARIMAEDREKSACEAREHDCFGSAKELELTALLLHQYADLLEEKGK